MTASIRLFFAIAFIGTLVSIASLALPWTGLDTTALATSGTIAGGIAATFGLAVAAIALRSYVYLESTERREIDSVWETVAGLQKELYYSDVVSSIIDNIKAEDPAREEQIREVLLGDQMKTIHAAIVERWNPTFLRWLTIEYGHEAVKKMALIRMGLVLSSHSKWHPNVMVRDNLPEIKEFVDKATYKTVKRAYLRGRKNK